MYSNRHSNTRKNAALLRQEAQCQARYRRNVFVTGLVLGILATVGMVCIMRTHLNPASAQQDTTVQASSYSNPLLQYAHGESGAAPDSSSPEDQSPQF